MSRLSEILGVEEGQEFEYKSLLVGCIKCKIVNGMRYTFDGYCWVSCTDEYILTEMMNHLERIKILPAKLKLKLTEQQIIAIKGRVAEGWNWIAKSKYFNDVYCFMERPIKDDDDDFFPSPSNNGSLANPDLFNFVTYENSPIYLPDLLGDEQE